MSNVECQSIFGTTGVTGSDICSRGSDLVGICSVSVLWLALARYHLFFKSTSIWTRIFDTLFREIMAVPWCTRQTEITFSWAWLPSGTNLDRDAQAAIHPVSFVSVNTSTGSSRRAAPRLLSLSPSTRFCWLLWPESFCPYETFSNDKTLQFMYSLYQWSIGFVNVFCLEIGINY